MTICFGTKKAATTTTTVVAAVLFLLVSCPDARTTTGIEAGDILPAFTLPGPDGSLVSTDSLKGSPAAVIFWSTWSPRSSEVLADFVGYHREHAAQGLRILAVNIEGENLSTDKKQAVRDYLAERDLPFPVMLDGELEVFSSLGVVAHPTTLVLDREGKITYILDGYPNTLRFDLRDELLKVLGLYREPEAEAAGEARYVPKGGALQYFSMGRRMLEMGQTEKALGYLSQARERDPEYADPAVMSARALFLLGEPEKARRLLAELPPAAVGRNDVRFLLAYLMLLDGEAAGAETLFMNLDEESPGEGWGAWGMGMVALSRNELAAAADLMERAAASQPGNYEAEAFAGSSFSRIWMQGEFPGDEERFLNIFPSLREKRDRYRNLFGPAPQ